MGGGGRIGLYFDVAELFLKADEEESGREGEKRQ